MTKRTLIKIIVLPIFLFLNKNNYGQSILHAVFPHDSAEYIFYDITINNSADSILILYSYPSLQLNTFNYEEINVEGVSVVNDYNITHMIRYFNLLLLPHQSTAFKLKIKKSSISGSVKFELGYKYCMSVSIDLTSKRITQQDDLINRNPVGYIQPVGFKQYIIQLYPTPNNKSDKL